MDEDWDDVELTVRSWDEPEAFGVVLERHAETLPGYFARRTLDPEATAELTAETFAQAFASRRRFRDHGLGAIGWLYGIARHQLGRFFRNGAVDARARRRLGMAEREGLARELRTDRGDNDFEQVGRAIGQAFAVLS
jgi:DNA-directed RNA polymerase specialized sigma24 family protein